MENCSKLYISRRPNSTVRYLSRLRLLQYRRLYSSQRRLIIFLSPYCIVTIEFDLAIGFTMPANMNFTDVSYGISGGSICTFIGVAVLEVINMLVTKPLPASDTF